MPAPGTGPARRHSTGSRRGAVPRAASRDGGAPAWTRHRGGSTDRAAPYRWAVLAAFMAVNLTIQVLWISYAPITSVASDYYGVSEVAIGALAMSFMVAYLPLSLPASSAIAHRGFRAAAGFGALLAGVAGVARGLAGPHYVPVLLATLGAAVAQPFLLNAWTTLSSHWFPRSQRATAVSLVTLANLVGAGRGPGAHAPAREVDERRAPPARGTASPPSPPASSSSSWPGTALPYRRTTTRPPEDDTAELVGVRHALHVRPFLVFLAVAFVGHGRVQRHLHVGGADRAAPRASRRPTPGTSAPCCCSAGSLGAVVLSAPVGPHPAARPVPDPLPGACRLLRWCGWRWPSLTRGCSSSAFVLGFFLTSAMPIGMQYSAEITVPTPEGTTNGLIQLAGQASVLFVLLMELTRTGSGSYTPSLGVLAALLLLGALFVHRLPEPKYHLAMRDALANAGDREQDGVL